MALCCHWASFSKCWREVPYFYYLGLSGTERHSSLTAVRGLSGTLLSSGRQRPPSVPLFAHFPVHSSASSLSSSFQRQLLSVCKHKGPRTSFCLSLHLSPVVVIVRFPPPPTCLRVCHVMTDDCAMSNMLLSIFKKHIFHIQLHLQRKMLRCNFDL